METANPHDWLPVGQAVRVTRAVARPVRYDSSGNQYPCSYGEIVEHLARGAVAVKFTDYPHSWDYSAREASQFCRVY
jgi:predicted secreted Zn-dependent protease